MQRLRNAGSGTHRSNNADGAHAPKWIADTTSSTSDGEDDDDDAMQSALQQERWRQRYNQSTSNHHHHSAFIGSTTTSSRQVNLHAYDADVSRRVGYVETKIGGHPLDHKRFFYPDWQQTHQPLKTVALQAAADLLWGCTASSGRSSPAYQIMKHDVLDYAATKIGGHPLDHVPFINRGQPSRPLLGYVAPRANTNAIPVFPRTSSRILSERIEKQARTIQSLGRNPAHLYDCSRCLRIRQSARVQLSCGHPVCSSCVSSRSMNHVESGEFCFLECAQCADFIAIEAVVFMNSYVVRINAPRVRTHAEFVNQSRSSASYVVSSGLSSTTGWKYGGIVAVLAYAAGKLDLGAIRKQPKKAQLSVVEVEKDGDDHLNDDAAMLAKHTAADAEATIENGAIRWQKRVLGLQPPSKLRTYSFVQTLGVGNFAEVLLVKNRKGELSVLKESDKLQEAVNEIQILSKIHSPHVVRIFQYFIEEVGHRHFAYIDMEYCDRGDLMKLLKEKGPLDAATFDSFFRQLCLGLQEIHDRGIIHRDLKPGNVLLTSAGVAKIADFGVSTCLESDLLTHHAAGTVAFMAPEVRRYFLGEDVSYDAKADIWSLGALAFAMLTGNPEPRVATRPLDELVEGLREQGIEEKYVSLVEKTLQPVPTKRASLQELLLLFPSMNSKL